MSRSVRRQPEDLRERPTLTRERSVDWFSLAVIDDLDDVPDLFPGLHEAFTSPINGGGDGWRAECATCGTVLSCHDTQAEAEVEVEEHLTNLVEG